MANARGERSGKRFIGADTRDFLSYDCYPDVCVELMRASTTIRSQPQAEVLLRRVSSGNAIHRDDNRKTKNRTDNSVLMAVHARENKRWLREAWGMINRGLSCGPP